MDSQLLNYYKQELGHLRSMAAEFAHAFPKIAKRLALEDIEQSDQCPDPYVERLLEGFAYMAARVQFKIDAEFPQFTQHLMEMVYPHYLAPTPSMIIAQLHPDMSEGSLASGFVVPRHSRLRSSLGKGEQTKCEYRTAHDVCLWPIEIKKVEYISNVANLPVSDLTFPKGKHPKAAFKIRLATAAGIKFSDLELDSLVLHLRGNTGLPIQIYERFIANGLGCLIKGGNEYRFVAQNIHSVGFADDQALLPHSRRSFSGYRLLQEYFILPERFLFLELSGLNPAVKACPYEHLEIFVLLNQSEPILEKTVDESLFALFCTPAINLFEKRTDRIHLNEKQTDYHIVVDRSKPMDYEIYQIEQLTGLGNSANAEQEFQPFYSANDLSSLHHQNAYYSITRQPRYLSQRQRRTGNRSSYLGCEVFVSLVDANDAPFSHDLNQLSIKALCTNRDLPLQMPLGQGNSDFSLDIGAPVLSIRCLTGPTVPKASHVQGNNAWRLISHLSLNYLSLTDNEEGAASFRELLSLYGDVSDSVIAKQIEGVLSIKSRAISRRQLWEGNLALLRGLEITVTLDDLAYEGSGVFLLGAVLEQFFERYVAMNTFTETVLATRKRGEIMRWKTRKGQRPIL